MPALSLKTSREFEKVKQEGFKLSGKYLILIVRRNVGSNKLGVIVSGKYGGAVVRNRTKRQIKEAYKAVIDEASEPLEVLIIPKQLAKGAKTADLVNDLEEILSRRQTN